MAEDYQRDPTRCKPRTQPTKEKNKINTNTAAAIKTTAHQQAIDKNITGTHYTKNQRQTALGHAKTKHGSAKPGSKSDEINVQ